MDRHNADEIWQLTPEYFNNCLSCLGKDHIAIFNASYDDQVIASYFVIHGFSTAYYHFGGSHKEAFDLRANNLLIYEIALWAKSMGYRWFHLGGGIEPGDGVYRFKSGFSNTSAHLYSSKIIHIPAIYDQLCQFKNEWNLNRHENTRAGFFPAYKG